MRIYPILLYRRIYEFTVNSLQFTYDTKLIEMGIEPYMISPVLIGIVAIRLARRICSKCKVQDEIKDNQFENHPHLSKIKLPEVSISAYRGAGCDNCYNSGYTGRIGLYEILNYSEDISSQILDKKNYSSLYEAFKDKWLRSFYEDEHLKD